MAELAEPLAEVTLRQLLKPLFLLAGCLVAVGIIYLCDAFVRALFGTVAGSLGWIPYLGRVIQKPVHEIEQKLTGALGAAEQAIDGSIAAYLHSLAHIPALVGNALLQTAEAVWIVAAFATALLDPFEWRKLYDSLVGKTQAQLVPIGASAKAANARSKVVSKTVAQGVWPSLREVEHAVDRVIPQEIKSTRTLAKEAEREAAHAWKYLRSHPWTTVTTAFVGAVAIALARLGLDWIRCPTAKSVFKKRGCNLWRDLDRLLGLVGEVALVTNICQVIPWLEEGFSVVAAPLVSTLTGIGAGLCGANSAPPELLPVTTLYVPSGPDATLYLP